MNTVLAKQEPINETCLACAQPESNDHIFVCPSRLAMDIKFQRDMTYHLATHGTCPTLAKTIMEGIARYSTCAHQKLPPPPLASSNHLHGYQS